MGNSPSKLQNSKEEYNGSNSFFFFFSNLMNCCKTKDTDMNEILTTKGANVDDFNQKDKELEEAFLILPEEYIDKKEHSHIKFTKEGFLDFISQLQTDNYNQIFDSNEINISMKESSLINQNNNLYRIKLRKSKKFFIIENGLEKIMNAMSSPDERKTWDKNIKDYNIIEKINEKAEIIKIISNKLFSIIGERVFIDKRIKFWDEGVGYCFTSSLPDEIYTPEDDTVRVNDYLGVFIVNEDEENYYLDSFNQVDIKMGIPESFIKDNLPIKVKEFYDNLFGYLILKEQSNKI